MNKTKKNAGAICGGCISESIFRKDPIAYMMAFVMKDSDFKKYRKIIESGDKKKANEFFENHAVSNI